MIEDEFYNNLKKMIKESGDLPGNYIFKFVIPNENKALAELQKIFDDVHPQFSTKQSSGGKYLSLTVQLFAIDEEYIIDYYKQAGKIKGIIML